MKKLGKCTACILSALVLTASVTGISATENRGATYISDAHTYYAEKISHSGSGVKTADGLVDYIGNGVVSDVISEDSAGDRAQSYSWSAVGYGDYMYIGTCANAMTNTLSLMKSALGDHFDEDTMKAALNAMYNGHFFVEEEDGGNPAGILVKLNVKTGEVKLLMSKATTGTNCLFRNAVEYKGNLYFCGSVNGIPSIYQINPETDAYSCVYQSMTLEEYAQAYKEGICVGIRGMCVFQDQLVVSLIGLEGAYICTTDTPADASSYKVVADMEDLFNYPAYHYSDSIYGGSVWDMVEYNNALYVSLCTGTPDNKPDENTMQSYALVRANVDENGNWNWTSVIGDQETHQSKYTFGLDPERTRCGAANLIVFDDYLYIGEYNDEEIALEDILFNKNCNFVNANLEQSVNLYRMDKNEDVELVVGDADEMFPEGSLTGIGSGFGRCENQYIWRMQVYNDKLYLGTFDTSSLLEPIGQFTNGDLLQMTPEEWESQLNYLQELIDVLNKKSSTPDEIVSANTLDDTLTSAQKKKVLQTVNDEDTVAELDTDTLEEAQDINAQIEELRGMISEKVSSTFLQKYQFVYSQLTALYRDIPGSIQKEYQRIINAQVIDNLKSFLKCAVYMASAERGFDLYALDKDLNLETVTTNGFGDPYNHGCRVFAVTSEGLCIGTANPFYGTQVWSLENMPYDYYDINRDGRVDILDATYMQMALAKYFEWPKGLSAYGDLNSDGAFNVLDVTELQLCISELS